MAGTAASTVLDEAFERLAVAGFELPNGFVNHGPMACEALAALGHEEGIAAAVRRFARWVGTEPVAVPTTWDWSAALGRRGSLGEWIGWFSGRIDADGWPAVVRAWVPRLMPALSTALYHGAIRTAHATRHRGR
jgi:hypothetical protein